MACGQNLDNKEVRSGGGGCKARPAAGGFSLSGPGWLLTGSIVHRMGEIVGKVGGIFLRGCGWGGGDGRGLPLWSIHHAERRSGQGLRYPRCLKARHLGQPASGEELASLVHGSTGFGGRTGFVGAWGWPPFRIILRNVDRSTCPRLFFHFHQEYPAVNSTTTLTPGSYVPSPKFVI